jgi:hypothetical protein
MKPDRCSVCQSLDLYRAETAASEGIVLRPSQSFWIGPYRAVVARFWVCLSCGFVAPYVADVDCATIRGWKENERRKRADNAMIDER